MPNVAALATGSPSATGPSRWPTAPPGAATCTRRWGRWTVSRATTLSTHRARCPGARPRLGLRLQQGHLVDRPAGHGALRHPELRSRPGARTAQRRSIQAAIGALHPRQSWTGSTPQDCPGRSTAQPAPPDTRTTARIRMGNLSLAGGVPVHQPETPTCGRTSQFLPAAKAGRCRAYAVVAPGSTTWLRASKRHLDDRWRRLGRPDRLSGRCTGRNGAPRRCSSPGTICGCIYDQVQPRRNPDGTAQGPRTRWSSSAPMPSRASRTGPRQRSQGSSPMAEHTFGLTPLGVNERQRLRVRQGL